MKLQDRVTAKCGYSVLSTGGIEERLELPRVCRSSEKDACGTRTSLLREERYVGSIPGYLKKLSGKNETKRFGTRKKLKSTHTFFIIDTWHRLLEILPTVRLMLGTGGTERTMPFIPPGAFSLLCAFAGWSPAGVCWRRRNRIYPQPSITQRMREGRI